MILLVFGIFVLEQYIYYFIFVTIYLFKQLPHPFYCNLFPLGWVYWTLTVQITYSNYEIGNHQEQFAVTRSVIRQ